MTKEEFHEALAQLGVETKEAAGKLLGIGTRSVVRYRQGTTEVPENVRRLLVMFIKHGVPRELRR